MRRPGLSPSAFSLFLKEQFFHFFSLLAAYLFSFSKREKAG